MRWGRCRRRSPRHRDARGSTRAWSASSRTAVSSRTSTSIATAGGSSTEAATAGRFAVDVGDDHRRTRLGEPGATGAPDAARSPGDYGNLPGERHELREGDARGVADGSHAANLYRRGAVIAYRAVRYELAISAYKCLNSLPCSRRTAIELGSGPLRMEKEVYSWISWMTVARTSWPATAWPNHRHTAGAIS